MKDITRDFWEKAHSEIEKRYAEGTGIKFGIGEYEFEIPLDVVNSLEKLLEYYEIGDLEDLQNNYETLTKQRLPSLKYIEWASQLTFKLFAKIADFGFMNSYQYKVLSSTNSNLGVNNNFGIIENVHVKILDYIFGGEEVQLIPMMRINITKKKNLFSICKLEIIDKKGNSMVGMLPYQHFPVLMEDKQAQKDLDKISGGTPATFYDLTVQAMPQIYTIKIPEDEVEKTRGVEIAEALKQVESAGFPYQTKEHGRIIEVNRGKILLVKRVIRTRGDREEPITPDLEPSHDKVNSLISSLFGR